MTPPSGPSRTGQRLVVDAPFGKWNTQTFIAGLRCDELIAPVFEDAINGLAFDTYVSTRLAPTLSTEMSLSGTISMFTRAHALPRRSGRAADGCSFSRAIHRI